MKKLIIFLISFQVIILLTVTIYVFTVEPRMMFQTITDMKTTVQIANRNAERQTQDIDVINKYIKVNQTSKFQYEKWLDAMKDYQSITIHKDNSISTRKVQGYDSIFQNDIIQFLKKDLKSVKSYDYSPLNFGITYLDKQKLEQDVKDYIVSSIKNLNQYMSPAKHGLYKIDLNTLEVKSEITATPTRIDLSSIANDENSKYQYLKLYGIDTNLASPYLNKSDIFTVVSYDIKYYVDYDYIPTTLFFRVKSDKAKKYASLKVPPKHIYFPLWYRKDGTVETNIETKLSLGQYKFIRKNPVEFNFNYTLTH